MIFRKWGEGVKAVWNFSKNSSLLETPPFPYVEILGLLSSLNNHKSGKVVTLRWGRWLHWLQITDDHDLITRVLRWLTEMVCREEVNLREGAHTGHRNWGLADELQLVEWINVQSLLLSAIFGGPVDQRLQWKCFLVNFVNPTKCLASFHFVTICPQFPTWYLCQEIPS